MSDEKKRKRRSPRTVEEALLQGNSYPLGGDDQITCEPAGGLGGFEKVRGVIDLFGIDGNATVSVPFTATLKFGKPEPASTEDSVVSP